MEPVVTTEDGPMVVSRGQVVALGVVVGLVLFLVIVALFAMFFVFNHKQNVAIHENRRALDALRKITKPTPREYRQQLREGFRRCAAEPLCRKVIIDIVKGAKPGQSGASTNERSGTGTAARAPAGQSTTPTLPRRVASRTPAGQRGPPGRKRRPGKPGSSGGGGSGGSGGGSQTTPAPVTATVPGVPPLCVKGVVAINCDGASGHVRIPPLPPLLPSPPAGVGCNPAGKRC